MRSELRPSTTATRLGLQGRRTMTAREDDGEGMRGGGWCRRSVAAGAIGVFIVATATASASTARLTAESAYWRASGRLIEVWDGKSHLWAMNADGTRRRPIADYDVNARGGASLSPSGRMVGVTDTTSSPRARALECAREVGDCDEVLLVLKRPGGGTIKQFRWKTGTTGVATVSGPVWAPDERAVAVMADHLDEPRIFVVDLRTGVRSVSRARSRKDWQPAWSPDGRRIAFISCASDGSNCHVAVMARDATGRRAVRTIDRRVPLVQPVWSPDGRAIALAQPYGPAQFPPPSLTKRQRYGIHVMRPDGSAFRRIAVTKPTGEYSIPLAWSQDSRRLVFADMGGISIADIGSRRQRRLTSLGSLRPGDVDTTLSWTPSAQILFTDQGDVYTMLRGRRPVRIVG